jgi:hypothetical protein
LSICPPEAGQMELPHESEIKEKKQMWRVDSRHRTSLRGCDTSHLSHTSPRDRLHFLVLLVTKNQAPDASPTAQPLQVALRTESALSRKDGQGGEPLLKFRGLPAGQERLGPPKAVWSGLCALAQAVSFWEGCL